jgi:glycosyltransferase involved in cell wall biosynthesis
MGRDFRIHSICVVKNEGDIIAHCLKDALTWSDRIIVYDNASDDDTWDIVRGMASEKIIPWKQDGKVFQESLRAEAFNAFRAGSKPGDWWCRLDADEFYIQDPRQFLANIPWPYHVVWGIAVEFYLTKQEVAQNELEPPGDINQQIERLRYYSINNSEPRFFRDRKGLQWPVDTGWPIHMGPVYPARLLYKHYKYRSPKQIQRRLDTRRTSVERGFTGWEHARDPDWRQKLADAQLLKEANGQRYEYREEDLPRHLEPPAKRYLKMALHQLRIFP